MLVVILILLALYFFYKTNDASKALRRRCEKAREDYLEKNINEIVKEALLEYYSGNIPKEMQDKEPNYNTDDTDPKDSTDDKESKES